MLLTEIREAVNIPLSFHYDHGTFLFMRVNGWPKSLQEDVEHDCGSERIDCSSMND